MKNIIFYLIFLMLPLAGVAQEYKVVTGEISDRFEKDGKIVLVVSGREVGKMAEASYAFIVDDVAEYYKVKFEYTFLLEVNYTTSAFNYLYISGTYSAKQNRITIAEYITNLNKNDKE